MVAVKEAEVEAEVEAEATVGIEAPNITTTITISTDTIAAKTTAEKGKMTVASEKKIKKGMIETKKRTDENTVMRMMRM